MFKDVQSSFVALGDGHDPVTIPAHYGKYYEEAAKVFLKFGHYGGTREIHDNYWPLICLLADQQKRIDELAAQVAAMEPYLVKRPEKKVA
jgi:hypothetical protein